MTNCEADLLKDSLFSLELVVEKVYIPHLPCRFPALAFRLVDFPTIVIKHVEDDLSKAIRRTISFDPNYQLPNQFSELKDKHGNFMVNKGKSCLFKMSSDALRQYLANTPLYVMIIDLFPEVPKLIGNSSIPLNSLMDAIVSDIAKVGSTVPSVHGEKGLFKVYNLMGKEIGYFVLGLRLLCLGPSLIPHLPNSMFFHQNSRLKHGNGEHTLNDGIDMADGNLDHIFDLPDAQVDVRNSACMTDPEKRDVFMQTIEMDDKAVNVAQNGIQDGIEPRTQLTKECQSSFTQTKNTKKSAKSKEIGKKWLEVIQPEANDDFIINNIVCPPALFYNSAATPSIMINRTNSNRDFSDVDTDDLSSIKSYDGQGLTLHSLTKGFQLNESATTLTQSPQVHKHFISQGRTHLEAGPLPKARDGETVHGLQVAPNPQAVFPLLTALLQELSFIQNPDLLLNVSNQLQKISSKNNKTSRVKEHDLPENGEKLPTSVVSAIAAELLKRQEISADKEKSVADKIARTGKVSQVTQVIKGQKNNTVHPAKKCKLVYGMTNTQRLRLQKTNPWWLKTTEKELAEVKVKKLTQKTPRNNVSEASASIMEDTGRKKQSQAPDVNSDITTDTLTEVRRLAEQELNRPLNLSPNVTGASLNPVQSSSANRNVTGASLNPVQSSSAHRNACTIPAETEANSSTLKKSKKIEKDNLSSILRSPQSKPKKSKMQPKDAVYKNTSQVYQNQISSKDSADTATDSSGVTLTRRPVPHVRHIKDLTTASVVQEKPKTEDEKGEKIPDFTSRSRSVEVSSPDLDDSSESIPLPDDSLRDKTDSPLVTFPRYLSGGISLPEPIERDASLNVSDILDENSPLESTRQSKHLLSDHHDSLGQQLAYNDNHHFQSTDEPELQGLVSERDNDSEDESRPRVVPTLATSQKFQVINPLLSESSPVPSVRRSTNKHDPTAGNYVPSFSQRLESSVSSRTSRSSLSGLKDLKAPLLIPKDEDEDPDLSESKKKKESDAPAKKAVITPRSTSTTPRHPPSRPQRSLHTDSVSSYMPSDPDNIAVSFSSYSDNYSDDFLQDIDEEEEAALSLDQKPRLVPSSKLGYTIN